MTYTSLVEPLLARVQDDAGNLALIVIGNDGQEDHVSIGRLHKEASAYACALQKSHAQTGDVVLLALPHSLSLISAFWGCLYLGAIPSILPFRFPKPHAASFQKQIRTLVINAGAKIVVTIAEYADELRLVLEDHTCEVLCPQNVSGQSEEDCFPNVKYASGEESAYLQYTSGTTGVQKGVLLSHQAILHFISAFHQAVCIDSHDVIVNWTPLYHDGGLFIGLLPALVLGVPAVMLSPFKWLRKPAAFWQAVQKHRGTVCWMPTSAFEYALSTIRESELEGLDLSSLRLVSNGGEPVIYSSQQKFLERFAPYGFRENALGTGYGMAEDTVCVTFSVPGECSPVDWIDGRQLQTSGRAVPVDAYIPGARPIVSCGRVLPGAEVAIMDDEGQHVPERHVGEVMIRSNFLFSGYYRRPELTQQAFRNGWFHSGDVGYMKDGHLYICDRKKDLLIVGGQNIYPNDLETLAMGIMQDHSGRVVAFGIYDENWGTEVPVLVCEVKRRLDEESRRYYTSLIRQQIIQELNVALGDVRFVKRGWVVKTTSGKIARSATKQKYFDSGFKLPANEEEQTIAFPASQEDVEQHLTRLFENILRIQPIDFKENILSLGTNSIQAAQLASRIQKVFQIDFSITQLFEVLSIEDLATRLVDCQATSATRKTAEYPPLVKSNSSSESYVLSLNQQLFWFHQQLEPDVPMYNYPQVFRLHGHLDLPALQQSFEALIRRHTPLRTRIIQEHGIPTAVLMDDWNFTLRIHDLQNLEGEEQHEEARRLLAQEIQYPFELSRDLMVRASVLRQQKTESLLLIVMHHIAADDWSTNIFRRELGTLYDAYSKQKTPQLPDLPIEYADFVSWQTVWREEDSYRRQADYWQQQLAGEFPALSLPTKYLRPSTEPRHQGIQQSYVLPQTLLEALMSFSHQNDVTLFMTLLTALSIVLHRYSGQEDIVLGAPMAGRTQVDTEGLIGCFLNIVALRTDLSGNPTVLELLARVRKIAIEAYAHQMIPFKEILQELSGPKELHRRPIFQVAIDYLNAPDSTLDFADLDVVPEESHNGTAIYDLMLYLRHDRQGLRCTFEYKPDLFETQTIQRMFGHFQTLLEGIVANPAQRISELPLLTEAERRQILVEWNNTSVDYPKDKCIHHLFEEQVERTPDAVAIVFEDQQLTYQELNAKANQLAHYLKKQGIGPERLVGICIKRSIDMVIGLLGILKAGGAYLPLDPSYPEERLAFMIEDADISILVTHQHLAGMFSADDIQMLCLDRDHKLITRQRSTNPYNLVTEKKLAYVMYTSGSTGQPKGVLAHHRGAINRFYWMWKAYPFQSGDICCQKTSLSFVDSIWEIWGPLLQGIPLVILRDDVIKDPLLLIKSLAARSITRIILVPSLLQALLEIHKDLQHHLPALTFWVTSGERLPKELVARFYQQLPESLLLNLYGSSEVAADATCYEVPKNVESFPRISIGRPISNTHVYILSSYLQPVPLGVLGELYVGGEGVARGYVKQAGMSAEKFLPDPFSKTPGDRLYSTGDLGRYLPDGNIEFLGRCDHQVKLRGFRIELGEVETMLTRHSFVREAVVTLQEAPHDEQRLVAYVVWEHDKEDELMDGRGEAEKQQAIIFSERHSRSELREYLKRMLPEYMIPSFFVFLDALPLTPNGKLDRHALPAPEMNRHEREEPDLPPGDLLERQLAEIWKQILHLQKLGIHDNFFDLGGHSLLAGKLLFEIEKAFDIRLPMITIFQSPTIEALAETLRRQNVATSFYSLIPIQPRGNLPPLFFIYPLGQVALHYNMQGTHSLSLRLGHNQPLYALRYGLATVQDIDDLPEPPVKIDVVAQQYLEDIQKLQPNGPYFLCGRSDGGNVAFEMACQLQQQGEQVALLALLDTFHPSQIWKRQTSFTTSLADVTASHFNRYANPITRFKTSFYLYRLKQQSIFQAIFNSFRSSYRGWRRRQERMRHPYILSSYPGRMILFESEERSRTRQATRWGWEQSVQGGVEVIKTPGWHGNMMEEEPNATLLAEKLRCCLARARAGREEDISGRTVEWEPLPRMLSEQKALLEIATTLTPGLVGFGIAQDFWMQDEAVLSLSPPAQMNSLEIRVESHAPARCYPLSLSVDNEEGKTLCTHIITQAGSSEITLELSHILRRPSHGYLKMSCDTTFIPHQENPENPDTRELGLRIPSGRYL